MELEILYQDEDFCVLNKPSGSVIHRTRGAGSSPVILQGLRDQLGKHIYPVHRLDRETSGCLVMAFSSEAAAALQAQLQSADAVKAYTALCRGSFESKTGFYDRPLSNEKKVKQEALTYFKVIREFEDLSLLELEIKTGRRHQIRRHLAHAVHQIVGDVNYGKGWLNRRFREEYDFHRMFLHCHRVRIQHPLSGEALNIECALPAELEELLSKLH